MNVAVTIGGFVVGVVVVLLWQRFLPAYFSEKGRNLATKEDIGHITNAIESVKGKHTRDLEQLRSDLNRAALEHQVQFSKLHEKRAEVLAELYTRLVSAMWAMETAASPMQWTGDPSKLQQLVTAMNDIATAIVTSINTAFTCHRNCANPSSLS